MDVLNKEQRDRGKMISPPLIFACSLGYYKIGIKN